jgi:hypothetical protein
VQGLGVAFTLGTKIDMSAEPFLILRRTLAVKQPDQVAIIDMGSLVDP